jgi:hypothetical protein
VQQHQTQKLRPPPTVLFGLATAAIVARVFVAYRVLVTSDRKQQMHTGEKVERHIKMSDKSPKSARKQATQKQAKADGIKQKKHDAETARQEAKSPKK